MPSREPGNYRLKAISDLVEETGCDPTEWEFEQLAESIRLVDEYQEYIDRGCVPPDLGYLKLKEARREVAELRSSALAQARTWREFRLAKKRHLDANVDGEMSVSLLEIMKARDERAADSD